MRNKVKNIKKLILTVVAVVCGVIASNEISENGVITTSYASGLTDIDGLKFQNATGGGIEVVKPTGMDTTKPLNGIIKLIKWMSLIGAIVLLGVFVYNIIVMGSSGTNVQKRTSAQQALVWSGMSAALLSIATTIFFFLQSSLT